MEPFVVIALLRYRILINRITMVNRPQKKSPHVFSYNFWYMIVNMFMLYQHKYVKALRKFCKCKMDKFSQCWVIIWYLWHHLRTSSMSFLDSYSICIFFLKSIKIFYQMVFKLIKIKHTIIHCTKCHFPNFFPIISTYVFT